MNVVAAGLVAEEEPRNRERKTLNCFIWRAHFLKDNIDPVGPLADRAHATHASCRRAS
jgi:hypothetical protein